MQLQLRCREDRKILLTTFYINGHKMKHWTTTKLSINTKNINLSVDYQCDQHTYSARLQETCNSPTSSRALFWLANMKDTNMGRAIPITQLSDCVCEWRYLYVPEPLATSAYLTNFRMITKALVWKRVCHTSQHNSDQQHAPANSSQFRLWLCKDNAPGYERLSVLTHIMQNSKWHFYARPTL